MALLINLETGIVHWSKTLVTIYAHNWKRIKIISIAFVSSQTETNFTLLQSQSTMALINLDTGIVHLKQNVSYDVCDFANTIKNLNTIYSTIKLIRIQELYCILKQNLVTLQ